MNKSFGIFLKQTFSISSAVSTLIKFISSLIFKYESMTKMFSHLEKINSGEEEALEAIEPVDPRKPVEEEDKESGKMDLFPLNEFGQSYLDMCKSTFGINLKGVSNSEANADEDGGGTGGSIASSLANWFTIFNPRFAHRNAFDILSYESYA